MNKESSDNKVIRTRHVSRQFVITVMRDGVRKYISREWSKNVKCTVLLNRAKRFQSEKQAMKHARFLGIDDRCEIIPIVVQMGLEEKEGW